MKKFAQIINDKVHHIMEVENKLPPFHPSIVFVEITELNPMPKEGWLYNEGIFSAPSINLPRQYNNKEKLNLLTDVIRQLKVDGVNIGDSGNTLIES